ncbi:MAG: histidine kinase [Cytophagales bacterium]|nr:MAG: histidine kinase [Cytophagales bacterium]
MLKSFDIYSQNNILKIIVALNLLLVGTGALIFMDRIIYRLEDRELQYVQLYAKALSHVQTVDINTDVNFITQEVLAANKTIPVIYINAENQPASRLNVDFPEGLSSDEQSTYLLQRAIEMGQEHDSLTVALPNGKFGSVYYSNSDLIQKLNYFPYALILVLSALGVLAYLSFSSSRRAEQNRVWVGLAKETAHQLGTPLSSLMAWVEYMRSMPEQYDNEITDEIEKDINRLNTITARFSSIGSIPTLKEENLSEVVKHFTDYLARRISTKVKMSVESNLPPNQTVRINRLLFEWVIENVCKNAVDAMAGVGELRLRMIPLNEDEVAIDITDTGKGISRKDLQKVFAPGFSTKKRGWGLGLTLAKRIVEEYHNGRLFVKSSEVGKGTTFRIVLNKEV